MITVLRNIQVLIKVPKSPGIWPKEYPKQVSLD